ncbi:hypothetical protein PZA11_002194 [Diplocarpon coronariae]
MNGTVLYSNKSAGKPHSSNKKSENKGGFKDLKKSTFRNTTTSSPNSPYSYCKQLKLYYKAEDCFTINKSKREA